MKISPSLLDADFSCLKEDLDSIASADRIHLDIMDGHFVPNLSFGAPVFKKVKFPVETEVHLMVVNPESYFESFISLGVKGITFHIELEGQGRALELLKKLKSQNIRAGITIDGYTSPDFLTDEILHTADQILVMSVKSGFGGQSFLPEALEKIKSIRARGFAGEIEVDGGVNLENVSLLQNVGADIVVVGSFLMKQPKTARAQMIREFQNS
jgi:ribulose-phosphate 3-epimerase